MDNVNDQFSWEHKQHLSVFFSLGKNVFIFSERKLNIFLLGNGNMGEVWDFNAPSTHVYCPYVIQMLLT